MYTMNMIFFKNICGDFLIKCGLKLFSATLPTQLSFLVKQGTKKENAS